MIRYGAAIFLGAFLLFQVQPIIGKAILPWFGGTPAVWTTCMVFFQSLLLAGYAYAHASVTWLSRRKQAALHVALLLACVCLLPIAPDSAWKPAGDEAAVSRILAVLAATVGGPYFVLSSTSPLLQAWFSRTQPGRSPYRLYALGNVGSLLALVSYPFVIEPLLPLAMQTTVWSWGFGLFALGCGVCAFRLFRKAGAAAAPTGAAPAPEEKPIGREPRLFDRALWLALPACASVLLLAATNQLSQDIPVVPFLWILPLTVYLLSFVLCFDHSRWYRRVVWIPALAAAATAACAAAQVGVDMPVLVQIVIHVFVLGVCCMICHGELVRLKPPPRRLTGFYLMIAAGGALGGVLVTLAAPAVFDAYWEYPIALLGCGALLLVVLAREPGSPLRKPRLVWPQLSAAAGVAGLVVAAVAFIHHGRGEASDAIATVRNFYGVLRVDEQLGLDETEDLRYLMNGRISHGRQFLAADRRVWPTSYYGPDSGIGVAREALEDVPAVRIGVVGLGAGVIATHARLGDTIRFYEINPAVVAFSREYFTFTSDTPAFCEIVLGDARLSMEREMARGRRGKFDILVLDAFTGDSIPLHLLTREAMAVYRYHLRKGGVLAVHISNRYVRLEGLVRGLAEDAGLRAVLVENDDDDDVGVTASTWVLVTGNEAFLGNPNVTSSVSDWPVDVTEKLVFTDDYSNLFRLLDFDLGFDAIRDAFRNDN